MEYGRKVMEYAKGWGLGGGVRRAAYIGWFGSILKFIDFTYQKSVRNHTKPL